MYPPVQQIVPLSDTMYSRMTLSGQWVLKAHRHVLVRVVHVHVCICKPHRMK